MLYPKCPKCGGKSGPDSEENNIDDRSRKALHASRHMFNKVPLLHLGSIAYSAGRQVYKRVPGGGGKRCEDCGHHFK